MSFFGFHSVVASWFESTFEGPTEPQRRGWPAIAAGEHTLISAPTGSGKTLTAFLACIDRLVKQSLLGPLPDEMRIIYVSPLRALSNDMHRNLELPLEEITHRAKASGLKHLSIRCGLRTGDTPQHRRQAIVRKPPHILVTTPESLYLMLTSEKAREVLATVETVIVDEIHALVRDKRGSHLALTLERLEHLCGRRLQRIGLSATQKPLDRIAQFLIGHRDPGLSFDPDRSHEPDPEPSLFDRQTLEALKPGAIPVPEENRCAVVEVDSRRELDLAIETPPGDLSTICSQEQWSEVNFRLVELIREHHATIIFVNTRRMAERMTYELTELLGEELVGSHHGSLAAKTRHRTEQKLKSGELKAVVATASLELGIDVGHIDLVIQMGSPRSIAAFLQRIGRSGHSLGKVPKGRMFALTRDELLEAMGLMRAVRNGDLERQIIPVAPLDVLAQQIVAEVAARDWQIDDLFALIRQSDPYRNLERERFDQILRYLSEGVTEGQGRRGVFLHLDQINRRVRARKNARLTAMINGGAIPEIANYRVVTDPEGQVVGTLDEHFAVETGRGDVFLLGNNSWRIIGIKGTDMLVADAQGAPPTLPFWEGEAPGRSVELSTQLSGVREQIEKLVDRPEIAIDWLQRETCCTEEQARIAVEYVTVQAAALGVVPTQKRIVFERFFDESGGMQLVVHAPFGMGVCKAWGFAMRKRFCRSFDFELQATADDNGFILSLGPQHSFPIESLFPMLTSDNCRGLLEQAMFQIPLFQVRWRWNVTRSLLVERMRAGKKVPPALQRFRADDLLTAVFPKLTGCQEEHTGDHILPDHPLTQQTMEDCLHEAMHLPGLVDVLKQIEAGEIELVARDTREPSPFAYTLLGANPYAFLDGGEAQERRARAVATRQTLDADTLGDLGRLDLAAIRKVRHEAALVIRSEDELHDALLTRVLLPSDEFPEASRFLKGLFETGRATTVRLPDPSGESNGRTMWVATERVPAVRVMFPEITCDPEVTIPAEIRSDWTSVEARITSVRGLMETSGPVTTGEVAFRLGFTTNQAHATLEALEGEGHVLRGQYTPSAGNTQFEGETLSEEQTEWCHRRLLSRIHRLTLEGLRNQIRPVETSVFMRYLFQRHGLLEGRQRAGADGLFETISMLQGIDVPAICWERDLLPSRLRRYEAAWLDELCLTGEVGWGRLFPKPRATSTDEGDPKPAASVSRVAPMSLWLRSDLEWLIHTRPPAERETLSREARAVFEALQNTGAMFAPDLMSSAKLNASELSNALGELVARGFVTADGFSGLRHLIKEVPKELQPAGSLGRPRARRLQNVTGRWCEFEGRLPDETPPEPNTERDPLSDPVAEWSWQLLRRWGVIFKDLLTREQGAPSWYELLQVLRRLEARGELRGGRFVTGVAGEQFALSETVRELRRMREQPLTGGEVVILCAADPVNLCGVLTDHDRVPSLASNRILYRDGEPIVAHQGGELRWLGEVPEVERPRFEAMILGTVKPTAPDLPRRARFQPGRSTAKKLLGTAEPSSPPVPTSPTPPRPNLYGNAAPAATPPETLPNGEEQPVRIEYPNGLPRPVIT